ncbi:hypothetical protein GUJ93_ZPchr0004g39302 [Zizania palustris]|uniref:Poly(A) polymerase nucleotidyltransferase domain-containing protein n=1 Tax=Zizania palustris TaxID=103762 RepID=A0A8J5VG95_ZIZPA|nr:hypothetical protein GUJ93_ZPchr0004g39302 [Zizania palustris]
MASALRLIGVVWVVTKPASTGSSLNDDLAWVSWATGGGLVASQPRHRSLGDSQEWPGRQSLEATKGGLGDGGSRRPQPRWALDAEGPNRLCGRHRAHLLVRPTLVDLEATAQLEMLLREARLDETPEEAALRETVLRDLEGIVDRWVKCLTH